MNCNCAEWQRERLDAIEAPTALTGWEGANLTVTVTNRSGAVTFPPPGAANGTLRFYRAVPR